MANPRLVGVFLQVCKFFVVKGPPLEVMSYLSFSLIFIAAVGDYMYQYLAGGYFSGKARELPELSASGVI